MSSNDALVIALILFTFGVAIVIGIAQYRKARKAKQQHVHTSIGDLPRSDHSVEPEPARTSGPR